MIKTILRNVTSNALKFTPKEGIIIIESVINDDSISVVISDTGFGMKQSEIDFLFTDDIIITKPGTQQEKGLVWD